MVIGQQQAYMFQWFVPRDIGRPEQAGNRVLASASAAGSAPVLPLLKPRELGG